MHLVYSSWEHWHRSANNWGRWHHKSIRKGRGTLREGCLALVEISAARKIEIDRLGRDQVGHFDILGRGSCLSAVTRREHERAQSILEIRARDSFEFVLISQEERGSIFFSMAF